MSITYRPPGTEDLAALKAELGKSNPEMAELFGMTPENWRKYTGGKNPRPVSPHMLFFAMARLELPPRRHRARLGSNAQGRCVGRSIGDWRR